MLDNQKLISRRNILKAGLVTGSILISQPASANPFSFFFRTKKEELPARKLIMSHLHTGEFINLTYFEKNEYVPGALTEINHFLRDFRTNDVHTIDTKLLDILSELHTKLDIISPFQIVSGYRSPFTNAMLHKHSRAVAKNSYHTHGMAIDICNEYRSPKQIQLAALDIAKGGVGYYPGKFVHVDTGPIRQW